TPRMAEVLPLKIGQSVKNQIENDLALEVGAVASYNNAIKLAVEQADNGSRELFTRLLKDEESHVDWLETQLGLIKEMGYEKYLSMQMDG
ncbi:MAG: ferritin-like domain-containing protein, partial [Bryobacteraceae bacterium]